MLRFLKDRYNPRDVILPTSIYNALKEEDRQEILLILKKWQWRLPIAEASEWIKSPEFAQETSNLIETSSPASKLWRLETDPSIVEEIAMEIREVAVKFKAPLIASSRSFKRWLSKKAVTILEVTSEEYKEFKRKLRKDYRESLKVRLAVGGIQWSLKGLFFIAIVVAIPSGTLPVALSSLLPSLATGGANVLYKAIVVDP